MKSIEEIMQLLFLLLQFLPLFNFLSCIFFFYEVVELRCGLDVQKMDRKRRYITRGNHTGHQQARTYMSTSTKSGRTYHTTSTWTILFQCPPWFFLFYIYPCFLVPWILVNSQIQTIFYKNYNPVEQPILFDDPETQIQQNI